MGSTMEFHEGLQPNALLRRLEEDGAVAYAHRIPVGFKLTPVAVQPDWRFDVALGPPVGALAVVTALQHTMDSTKIEAMYLDRDPGGTFRLGRGFQLQG